MSEFIVVGAFGVMGLTKQGVGLRFGIRRATVATVFESRRDALKAIRLTERDRRTNYPDEKPWLNMKIVRLVKA